MRISDWSSDVCSSDLPVVILFTTGRGTPLGFPVPTIKVASNHDLAARKPGWIDFDGGQVLDDGMNAGAAALLGLIAASDRCAAPAARTPRPRGRCAENSPGRRRGRSGGRRVWKECVSKVRSRWSPGT